MLLHTKQVHLFLFFVPVSAQSFEDRRTELERPARHMHCGVGKGHELAIEHNVGRCSHDLRRVVVNFGQIG